VARRRFTVVGLGELLWDILPGSRALGGAPANFAYHAAALGDEGVVASRVGRDELGREAVERLRGLGLATDFVQEDALRPTGTVHVRLDGRGVPDFTISPDAAWDSIEWNDRLAGLASRADAVCFGTLAQRSARTRETIRRFLSSLRAGALAVFDANLRQSYWSAEVLRESLGLSTVAKFSDGETGPVARTLGFGALDEEAFARRLLDRYELELVCITRGERGCLLVSAGETVSHEGFRVNVADTVGAGDAFAAALAHHLLRGSTLETAAEAANRLGAWVASRPGATPPPDARVIELVTGGRARS